MSRRRPAAARRPGRMTTAMRRWHPGLHLLIWLALPLVWGSTFAGTKLCLRGLTPLWMAALRYAIATLLCLPLWWRLTDRPRKRDAWRQRRLILLASVSGVFLAALFQNVGLQYTTATAAALLSPLEPVFMATLCVLVLRERLAPGAVAGLLLAAVGGWILATNGGRPSAALLDGTLWGNGLIVLSMLSYAAYTIVSKRLLDKVSPLSAVALSSALGLVLLTLAALACEPLPDWRRIGADTWGALLYMGMAPTALAYGLYNWLLRRVPASRMTVVLFLIPVYGALLGVLILREPLHAAAGVGAGLTFLGIGLFEWRATRRPAG